MADSTVTLTIDEQKRLKYYKTNKEIAVHHNELAVFAQSVVTLALHVGALDKGKILRFYDGDEFYEFSKKDLRAATAKLVKAIKELTTYWKVSRKKPKVKSSPESLKGTYTPIYAGDVLKEFFSKHANFGPLDVQTWKDSKNFGTGIMESLPYAQKGFMLRNTLTMLFFLYARTMGLQEVENAQFSHFDDHMTKVFTTMPAAFYTTENVAKLPMSEAIKKGYVETPISTLDVIRLKRSNFNQENTPIIKNATEDKQIYRKAFANFFFQLLASNNYYSKKNLEENVEKNPSSPQILEALTRKDVTDQMIAEHNLVHDTAMRWSAYLAPKRKAILDKKKKELAAKKLEDKKANQLASQSQD